MCFTSVYDCSWAAFLCFVCFSLLVSLCYNSNANHVPSHFSVKCTNGSVSRAGMAVNFRSLTCGPAAPGVPGSPLAPLPPGAPCKMQRNTVKRVFQCKRTETLTEVKSSYLRSRRASPPICSLNNNNYTLRDARHTTHNFSSELVNSC